MEENLQRDFKGIWIPKEVWLDERLNALDKVILMEIYSLDNGETGCYASNTYLAKFCQCTETKVSTTITKLKELGYVELADFDGRHRLLKIKSLSLKNLKADIKKFKPNNIDNKIDYNKEYIPEENEKSSKKDEKDKYIEESITYIIDYLNKTANTNYKANTKGTIRLIKARFKEGYKLDDFYDVIDNKWNDWKNTEWEKYMRPETLFGNKFESYLNTKKFSGKPKSSFRSAAFDNTNQHQIPKGTSSMDEKELQNFTNSLAKDSEGNFLKF